MDETFTTRYKNDEAITFTVAPRNPYNLFKCKLCLDESSERRRLGIFVRATNLSLRGTDFEKGIEIADFMLRATSRSRYLMFCDVGGYFQSGTRGIETKKVGRTKRYIHFSLMPLSRKR